MNKRGFTLMEVLVTVLLVGILAAFAIPQYLKAMENSKADDAVAMVNMIATTNRMFALDHSGILAAGLLPTGCSGACNSSPPNPAPVCELVRCKYLAEGAYSAKPYDYRALAGGALAPCPAGTIAMATRKTVGQGAATQAPYTNWAYCVDTSGQITEMGGAPPPTQ